MLRRCRATINGATFRDITVLLNFYVLSTLQTISENNVAVISQSIEVEPSVNEDITRTLICLGGETIADFVRGTKRRRICKTISNEQRRQAAA